MGLESVLMEGTCHVRVGVWQGAVLSFEAVFVPLSDHTVVSSTLERTANPGAVAANMLLAASEVPGLPNASRVRLLALAEAVAEASLVQAQNANDDLAE